MKKRLLYLALAALSSLGAQAIDKAVKTYVLSGEVTSVEELAASTFVLQNTDGQMMYTPTGWDIKVGSLDDLTSANNVGGYYKLEAYNDTWLIPVYDATGSQRTYWAGVQYVNTQPAGQSVIFGLAGTNEQHGQDGANLALWKITYAAGKGFAFNSVGRTDTYIGYNATAAQAVQTITYWRAYTKLESGWDAAKLAAKKTEVLAAIKNTDPIAAINAASTNDALAAALNNAIDDLNASETELNATLDAAGQAVAATIKTKYNNGEYKNSSEVAAAMIAAYKAQTSAGSIMTAFINNPTFDAHNTNGWVSAPNNRDGGYIAGNKNFGLMKGADFVERWTGSGGKLSDGSFTQEITGLPAGTYTLTAEMQCLQQQDNTNATGLFLYAKGTSEVTAECTAPGTISLDIFTDDGTLTIGTKLINCQGNWICFDSFTLTLKEPANAAALLAAAKEKYEAALQKALDVDLTQPMYGEAKDAVMTKTTTYSKGNTSIYTKPAEYETATAELEAVTAAALKSIEEYASLKYIIDYYNALDPAGKEVAGYDGVNGNRLYKNFVNKWNKGTLDYGNVNLEGESGIINLLREAVKAQNTVGADYTAMIDNPNFDTDVKGWTDTFPNNAGTNHGFQGSSYTNGEAKINAFFEAWAGQWAGGASAPYMLKDGKLSQTITELPAGKYTLEADMLGTQQYTGAGYPASQEEYTGVYLYANGATLSKTLVKTGNEKPAHFTVNFTSKGGDAEIGLMVEESNCVWTAIDNVKLYYQGESNISPFLEELRQTVDGAMASTAAEAKMANKNAISSYKTAYDAAKALYDDESNTDEVYKAANESLIAASKDLNASIKTYEQIAVVNQAVVDLDNASVTAAYATVLATYTNKTATSVDPFKAALKAAMPTRTIEGTPFELGVQGNVEYTLPENAISTFTFSGQWQSIAPSIEDFPKEEYKKITIKFAEPLPVEFNEPGTINGNINWHCAGEGLQGATIMEVDVQLLGSITGFSIQNIQSSNHPTIKIESAYAEKMDATIVPIVFKANGGVTQKIEGLTSTVAKVNAQWAGITLNLPEDIKDMNGTKTIRIYTNDILNGLPFQWALNTNGTDKYPGINIVDPYYAEFTTEDPISSIYLQHTTAESHTIDIKAITWTITGATPPLKKDADVTTFAMSKKDGNKWTFTTAADLTGYKYMVVVTRKSSGAAGGNMTLTDAEGMVAGNWQTTPDGGAITYNKEAAGTRGDMWLDRWNNQNCAIINLQYLKAQGLNTEKIKEFSVPDGDNISAVYLSNYETGKAIAGTGTYVAGDHVREIAMDQVGKYGTVALKYAAAVSGAYVYTVDSWDEEEGMVLSRHEGVLEAGVPYFYQAADEVGANSTENGKGSAANVNFFRVDGNEITGDWSDDKDRDNGLVGYYDGGFWPGAGALTGCYVLSNNKLLKIDGGEITLGANRCFFDPEKYQGPKSGAGVKAFIGIEENETAIKSIELSKQNGKIYDMNGREVKTMQKGGLYIMNGMKVMVK